MTFKHKKYNNRSASVLGVHDNFVLYVAVETKDNDYKRLGVFRLPRDKFMDRYTGVGC